MTDTAPAERLQKALARAGLGSRREIERWIRDGRITVNGRIAALGAKVGPSDQVRLDGRLVRERATVAEQVFVLHRSPSEDLRAGREGATGESLIDRLPARSGRRYIAISPLPRVDGGLEIVTSDGELALKLQRAVRGLACGFSVRVHGELGAEQLDRILAGELDSGARVPVGRCEAMGGEGSNRWYDIETVGASGRDVRQIFERQGALVSRVLRTQLGSVRLDRRLLRGQFRKLEPEELAALTQLGSAPEPQSPLPLRPRAARAAAHGALTGRGSRNSAPSRRGPPGRAARHKG
ncbi:MAG: S4 domain-containing protein [Steroidobacteraceae bacterium]